MPKDNPMLAVNVRLWKHLSVIFPGRGRQWRLYLFVLPVCVMNVMQFVYLFRMWGNLATFILNSFFAAAIFDALLRTCLVIINRDKFESFMLELVLMYNEIEKQSNDVYAKNMLKKATVAARKISVFNLTASFCDIIGALTYPLLCEGRVHPFGVALPGVDMTSSPIYEIFYVLQVPTPLVLTAMYMPFVSLFASFALFGKTALKILQHRLKGIGKDQSDDIKFETLRKCIEYYIRLESYVHNFNFLVTYIVCVEFLLFGSIICSLLFCMNIIETYTQIVSIIMYILTMIYVLFTYYWYANEIIMESINVSEAAYSIPWYYCNHQFRKTLLLFIIRTHKPLQIMVGNVYPMTLATFQSLLNTSYTYFTMLRGLYNQ